MWALAKKANEKTTLLSMVRREAHGQLKLPFRSSLSEHNASLVLDEAGRATVLRDQWHAAPHQVNKPSPELVGPSMQCNAMQCNAMQCNAINAMQCIA